MSIDISVQNHIAKIVINRPERLNAMDGEHYVRLSQAWTRVRDDNDIRVAIITGAGEKSFTVGADLKSFINAPPELSEMWLTQRDQLLNRGLEVWKPVISAVNGFCIGGGVTLLLATDIRIAAPHATFGLSEVKRGIVAANGGTQRLLSQVPYAIGMEMLLTGDSFDAATAERWGLVNKVVPASDVLPLAEEYARRIALNAPLAVQATKELAIRARSMDLVSGLRFEQMMTRLLQCTSDAKEGPQAFAAKRPPNFEGK